MYFLFSGEGPTDCGTGTFPDRICEAEHFKPGPMAHLVSKMVESAQCYSPLDSACCGLVSRPALKLVLADLKSNGNRMSLPGKRQHPETLTYRRSARALARWAKQWASEKQDEVVAIYVRDTDDRQSTPSRDWEAKWDAVSFGFKEEGFAQGVPMLPRPTSEAWLLCALKERPYEQCEALEERTGSPNAKRPLKKELAERLGAEPTGDLLCPMVEDGKVDAAKIDMPSFNAFRERLLSMLQLFNTGDGSTKRE